MKMKNEHRTDFIKHLEAMVKLTSGSYRRGSTLYCCMEDFVLRNGQFYEMSALPDDVARGQIKQCYFNSQKLVEKRGLRYVEGFALRVIPVLHAWVVDADDRVIDTTWESGKCYFGVVFPIWYVHKLNLLLGRYGVIDAYELGHPLLTGEHEYPMEEKREEMEV